MTPVAECLARIKTLQPEINAFITVTEEAEIRSDHGRGPLQGMPIAVKDFYDTAGIRTTAAFSHFRNRIPHQDAVSVAILKQAGAILMGKTNMHTLGMGTTGLESAFGPVRNPRNPEYIPGGSSSGSAAAVATGMCYATLDTDAIGSCRLPAGIANIAADRRSISSTAFSDIDVLVLPTLPCTVPTIASCRHNPLALPPTYTAFANYYGLPALTVPCGTDNNGLPLGLQFVGRPHEDAVVLRIARAYETAASRI